MSTETDQNVPLTPLSQKALSRKKKLLALNAEDQQSYEKKVKKLRKKGTPGKKESGVMYVGHLHNEFTERELRGYFGQFGNIVRLRLSRSKKTGSSRGFGFIEFDDLKDAKIAAKTMDKYLMHQRLLKCAIIPKDKIHEDLWKGINRPWNFGAGYRSQRRKYNKIRTEEKMKIIMGKRQNKDNKIMEKLKAMGIEYELPKTVGSTTVKSVTKSPPAKKTKKEVGPKRRKRALPEAGVDHDDEDEIKKSKK